MSALTKSVVFALVLTSLIEANQAPYFVEMPQISEVQTLLKQKFTHAFDTVVPFSIDSVKKDSTFACQGSSCQWSYSYVFDTIQRTDFTYNEIDSFTFIDTVIYSFFDNENDSCHFTIWLVDSMGNRVPPDSVWGKLDSRPGTNNRLCFSYHSLKAGNRQFVVAMNQVQNIQDTIFDTIARASRVVMNDRVASDSSFLQKIQGNWRRIYSTMSRNFISDSTQKAMVKDTLFIVYSHDSLIGSYTIPYKVSRIGFNVPRINCTGMSGGGLLSIGDTLIYSFNLCGMMGYSATYVYVRDLSPISVKKNVSLNGTCRGTNIAIKQFGSTATVHFSIEKPSMVDVRLYNLNGKQIAQIVQNHYQAGNYSIPLSKKALSHQIYMLKVQIGGNLFARSVLIK